jgi:Na+/melibiose symporter-like transporter
MPLGALSIVGLALSLQNSFPAKMTLREKLREVDFVGPTVFLPVVLCLLLALQWGGVQYSWTSPTVISLFAVAGALMPIWIWIQIRLGEKAAIPMSLLKQRTVLFSSLFAFCLAPFTVLSYYIPFYFQAIKDSDALQSGVQSLPMIVAVAVAAILGSAFTSRIGYVPPFMIGGGIILITGVALVSTFDLDTSLPRWVGFQVVAGVGIGITISVQRPSYTCS